MVTTSSDADGLSAKLASLNLSKLLPTAPADIKLALELFSDSQATRSDISRAYAYLARLLLISPNSKEPDRRDEHIHTIARILNDWLSETTLLELGKAFASLAAVVQTDLDAFVAMLNIDAMDANISEAGEALTMGFKIFDEQEYAMAKKHFASFVSQAAGYGKTRTLARNLASLSGGWLAKRKEDGQEADQVKAAAAVTAIKLQIPDETPVTSPQSAAPSGSGHDDIELLKKLSMKAAETQNIDLAQLAFEGIGLSTLKPSARRLLTKDEPFVSFIISQAANAYSQYTVAVILANVSAYHRPSSEEEKTKERLRQYAKHAGKGLQEEEKQESDEEMDKRNALLLKSGIMSAIIAFVKSKAMAVRRLCSNIVHALVQKREHRGLVIQQGGAKALLYIIKLVGPTLAGTDLSKEDLIAVQALAKLFITSNPLLVVSSDAGGLLDALKPLSTLILSNNAHLLQQFEATMALTNIASLSEELADRIANLEGLLSRLEEILLEAPSEPGASEGRTLCRRAATEVLCNLISSDVVFLRYTAMDQLGDLKDGKLPSVAGSRLHVLVMLSDVEDLPTRQAALAALAQITHATTASKFIAGDDKRFGIVMSGAEDEDTGMQLRAIACLANIASNVAERKQEIKKVLESLAKSKDTTVKGSAIEALAGLA